jgi:GGDEF domain-containing protein
MRFLLQGNFRYHRYHFVLVMQKDEPTQNLKVLETLLQAHRCDHTYMKRNMTTVVSVGILVGASQE